MKKVYDAVAVTGKYTDRQSGKEKSRYLNVGAVFVNDDGKYSLKLEALPVANFNGWINFFEPRERGEQKPEQSSAATEEPAFDDKIPF